MVFRLQNQEGDLPHLNSKQIEKYCDSLLSRVYGPTSEALFKAAGETVSKAKVKLVTREQPERTKLFTTSLIEASTNRKQLPAASQRLAGIVKVFSDVKGFGFITADDGAEIFVHYTGIAGQGYKYLMAGERVEFALTVGPKGPAATEVEIIVPEGGALSRT